MKNLISVLHMTNNSCSVKNSYRLVARGYLLTVLGLSDALVGDLKSVSFYKPHRIL